jgi:hypothetical protein
MKFASLIAVAAILSLVAIPAMAELTDYQKGVNDGLASGLRIGYLLGGAPYSTSANQQYSSMVNSFNSWLQSEFGSNQTEINLFWMKPLSSDVNPNVVPYSTSTINKPVHAIDASFNQTNRSVLGPQGQTIYGEPIDHYCTDNPNAPACDYRNTPYNGQINPSTGQPYGSDQPLGGV